MTHELKCWAAFYDALADGTKTLDVREKRDRDFQVGDTIVSREYMPNTDKYTGRVCSHIVTYVLDHPSFCRLGQVIMGIRPVTDATPDAALKCDGWKSGSGQGPWEDKNLQFAIRSYRASLQPTTIEDSEKEYHDSALEAARSPKSEMEMLRERLEKAETLCRAVMLAETSHAIDRARGPETCE